VEIQIQSKEMIVHATCNSPYRLLCNCCEDCIADLLKNGCSNPGNAIGYDHAASNCVCGSANGNEVDVHAINYRFEVEWNLDIE